MPEQATGRARGTGGAGLWLWCRPWGARGAEHVARDADQDLSAHDGDCQRAGVFFARGHAQPGRGLATDLRRVAVSIGAGRRPFGDRYLPGVHLHRSRDRLIASGGSNHTPVDEQVKASQRVRTTARRETTPRSVEPAPVKRTCGSSPRVTQSKVSLYSREFSAPGWIRTNDLRIRSPLLYPAELQGPNELSLVGGRAATVITERLARAPLSTSRRRKGSSGPLAGQRGSGSSSARRCV